MTGKLTDAELIQRLRLVKKHGGVAQAAAKLGLGSAFATSIRDAKARGLTAEDQLPNAVAALETKLKIAERELATVIRENNSAESIRQSIYDLAALSPSPPDWLVKKGHAGNSGVPVAIWSDWHWGERVNAEEVGGVNQFDRKIAVKRVKRLVEVQLSLTKDHMVNATYPGIVICLAGDMITGTIHEELMATNDGSVQTALLEVQEVLEWALGQMADRFGKVFVPCVVGNHGRMTMKPRAKGAVYESYEWNLYCQLEKFFRNDDRIQFLIPGETDAYFKVQGHRFLLTHGDNLGVKGGDGIIGAIGPIARGATKVGRSEAQIGRDFDTLLMGHYHTYIPRGDAVPVVANGALIGYNEYARLRLRVPYSRPSQALFFVHEKYGITAQWQMYLDDKHKSADTAEWLTFQKRSNP